MTKSDICGGWGFGSLLTIDPVSFLAVPMGPCAGLCSVLNWASHMPGSILFLECSLQVLEHYLKNVLNNFGPFLFGKIIYDTIYPQTSYYFHFHIKMACLLIIKQRCCLFTCIYQGKLWCKFLF